LDLAEARPRCGHAASQRCVLAYAQEMRRVLVSQSSCEAAASPFPITARRPVLWCSGIRNRMPWIALSEHTIPVCGQVPVARRSHHPAMYALHTSRSQRAWLRLFFLAVRMLASALSSHVPVTCLQKISCPGSPCKRPRLCNTQGRPGYLRHYGSCSAARLSCPRSISANMLEPQLQRRPVAHVC